MPETSEVVTAAKTLAEHSLQAIHDTWTKVLQWDSHKQGISPTVLFFSPSLILVCFTVISHCFSYTSSFSFLICGAIAIHAFLKLTQNPISTSLHYQFVYSCTFSLLVLGYSPALPSAQAKTLLAVLFPIYFHTLTSSVSITLLISCPIFLFLLFSSLHEPFSHTTLLAALIVIPTIFWTKSREEHHVLEQVSKHGHERPKDISVTEKKSSSTQDTLPSSSELKERNHDPTLPNAATEEHEKVILGISHDCRNLLNSLKAILTLMKDDIDGDETQSNQDDNLQSAIAITEHLTLLLTSLLDFLKKKNDDVTTTNEEMKMTTTLEKIWLMIAPNLKRKNLGGSITIRNGTPPSVCLDESKFMGVLLNLIGNAMKFTDTGHIKVNVHWRDSLSDNQTYGLQDARANIPIPGEVLKKPSFSPGKPEDMMVQQKEGLNSTKMTTTTTTFYDMKEIDSISFTKKCFTVMSDRGNQSERPAFGVLVVTVRDTGCGIDAESLKKLFKKYGQVGSDKEKNKLGLGLGLWYTKYLLGKLNGKIDFRSTKDVGTWVKIEIPCKIIPQKREVRQMIAPEIPLLQTQKSRQTYHPCVYIKENDRLAGLLINEYLKKHLSRGAQVFEIPSVLDIVRSEKMRTGIYMIVLGKMSVTRQELQGLRMLNKLHPDEKVPIVLLKEAEDTIQSSEDKDWADLDVEISVKKPIRQTQLDEVLKVVETIVSRSLFKEAVIKQRDEVAHVLIVDDDNTSVLFLQKYLAKNGRACLVAKDGYEATEIYRTKWADIRLIIMDSEMPRMNGLEATKAIRRMGKDEELKIIGLTGNDTDEFREKAVKIGMNQVFVKPVPTERLLHIVNSALDIRQ